MAWEKVCSPKQFWGAGILNFDNRNIALGAKLVSKMYTTMVIFGPQ